MKFPKTEKRGACYNWYDKDAHFLDGWFILAITQFWWRELHQNFLLQFSISLLCLHILLLLLVDLLALRRPVQWIIGSLPLKGMAYHYSCITRCSRRTITLWGYAQWHTDRHTETHSWNITCLPFHLYLPWLLSQSWQGPTMMQQCYNMANARVSTTLPHHLEPLWIPSCLFHPTRTGGNK